ncbi:MAG: 5'-methylthioadenosine/S-adenosylhomocysteine nucleosidase, partial [Alphaproteobacteria bacterium]|nr:5'-methylthioadenosine/S-adenosylhomocysteine nucleosidase [Alphaproteobacteria bacterium]
MRTGGIFAKLLMCMLLSTFGVSAKGAELLDATPRTAIISAYQPEWVQLRKALENSEEYRFDGATFVTGTIEDKPVVLFLSGISIVNAAMTTQLALDCFVIDRLVFSGIAGGVDRNLEIGDVVVPDMWAEYLESVFARESNGKYALPSFATRSVANFGMIFPQPVEVATGAKEPEQIEWFHADPGLLAIARRVAGTVPLKACTSDNTCLSGKPRVVVGGRGVSGQAFVDNEAFRNYLQEAFAAEAVDMESAAVAQVAYVNAKPFIAFRSLSDLAGGGEGENELNTFFQLAADNSAALVVAFMQAL